MGAWIENHFAWHGVTNRAEYRRWLPLIIIVEMMILAGLLWFGERGTIRLNNFGWPGILLFFAGLIYFIGWLLLTARRLRSAEISRAWLLITVMTCILPVGDTYINIPAIASVLLTVVAAMARDRRDSLAT